jgi:hypothetical protein
MATRFQFTLALTVMTVCSASASGQDRTITLDGMKSALPAEWKVEKSTSQMRAHQFRLPKVDGDADDAEVVVFYFGAGGGGTIAENVKRWKQTFVPPSGKSIDDVAKVEEMKVGDTPVTYLDVSGTYKFKTRPNDPNSKEELKANSRMIGVVFASKNGPYFIRFVGPEKTVTHHKKGFDGWLKAFK